MSQPLSGPGYRATLAALATGQLLVWATLYYAFSSFVLPMQSDLGWSRPTLMGAFTLGLALWGLGTYAVGSAIDRGHGRSVMAWGPVLGGLGFLVWSRVTQPWMLYAAWTLIGLAMAMSMYEAAFSIVTRRYPGQFRQAITVLTLVGGFASTLSFPAIAWLMSLLGWRDTLAALGLVLLAGVAPLHLWALRGTAFASAAAKPGTQPDATLNEALRHTSFWLLTLCFTLLAFGSAAMWAHVMPAFASKGVSDVDALTVLVWIGPAQVAGRFAQAWLGQRLSLRTLGSVAMLGQPLALGLFAWTASLPWLLLFALLFGLANGLVTIVRGGVVPEYFGRANVGRIAGTMSGIGLLARAAAPLAAAWLLLLVPGYNELLALLAFFSLLGVLAFWAAGPPRPG